MRERWYLFGNDPELALELLRRDLDLADSQAERAALVHLARWFDWPTLLLLHQHPDERWQPLLQNRAQPGRTQIIQQVQYNQWADLPSRVVAQLKHWLSLAA